MSAEQRDNRLHRLLEFIIKEYDHERDGRPHLDDAGKPIKKVRYEFDIQELAKHVHRFSTAQTYEASHLCRVLEKNNCIQHSGANESFQWILNAERLQGAREAYFSEKFKEKEGWIIAVYFATIANVVVSIAVALITYYGNVDRQTIRDQSLQIDIRSEEIATLKDSLTSLKGTLELLREASVTKTDTVTTK